MARIVRTLVMQPQLVAVAHPKCRFRIALFLSRFPPFCLTVHLESVSSHVANKARNGHAQLRQDLHFLQTRRLFLFLLTRSTSLTHTHTLSLKLSLSVTHLGVQECQTLVDIFDFVYAHASAIRLAQLLRRYYLQQLEQLYAIG